MDLGSAGAVLSLHFACCGKHKIMPHEIQHFVCWGGPTKTVGKAVSDCLKPHILLFLRAPQGGGVFEGRALCTCRQKLCKGGKYTILVYLHVDVSAKPTKNAGGLYWSGVWAKHN